MATKPASCSASSWNGFDFEHRVQLLERLLEVLSALRLGGRTVLVTRLLEVDAGLAQACPHCGRIKRESLHTVGERVVPLTAEGVLGTELLGARQLDHPVKRPEDLLRGLLLAILPGDGDCDRRIERLAGCHVPELDAGHLPGLAIVRLGVGGAERDVGVDLGGELPGTETVQVLHVQVEFVQLIVDLILVDGLMGHQRIKELTELLGRISAKVAPRALRRVEVRHQHAEALLRRHGLLPSGRCRHREEEDPSPASNHDECSPRCHPVL